MMWQFEAFGERTAVVCDDGRRLSYASLAAEGVALAFAAGGRCLVFCLCENSPGSLLGYTAFLNHGMVPALLPRTLDTEMLDGLLTAYRPKYLWAPAPVADLFAGFVPVHEALGYALLRTPYEAGFPLHDELALLLTTSGSTGSPKFVRQSYANIRANTQSIVEYLALDESERAITTLPMHYTYGLSILTTHLWVGAQVLLTEKTLMQRDFWDFFKAEGATSFGGVPYTYEMLKKLRFFGMDLPSLRTMTQAGGKLSPALHEEFARFAAETKRNFVVMYGQCEATARMGWLPPEKSLEKAGRMGVAIPGGRFELRDAAGLVINAPDTEGELVYYGENVTLGYAERGEDLARGDERGGVLHTGDVAKRDTDGYYTITGRLRRFLKIYGSRVNLDEAERLLRAAFPKEDIACGGADDALVIYRAATPDADEAPDEAGAPLRRWLAEKTKLPLSAITVHTVAALPRNEAGKILYAELEGL